MKTVKALSLNYSKVIRTALPKRAEFCGITAQLSEHSATVKPFLVYIHDDAFPQLTPVNLFLARGQCDLEHPEVESFDECMGVTYDSNRRTNNIATLWKVTPKVPEEILPPTPPPRPRIDYTSPESREAIEAAKAREEKKEELLKVLKKENEDPPPTPAVGKDQPAPDPAPDEVQLTAFEAAIAALPEDEETSE